MTRDELLAALAPPRLPADMASLGPREALAMAALGLLAALAIWALLRPILRPGPSRRAAIRASRGLPAPERMLALARALGRLPEALRPAAYGAAPPPSDPEIERIALAAPRHRRRP